MIAKVDVGDVQRGVKTDAVDVDAVPLTVVPEPRGTHLVDHRHIATGAHVHCVLVVLQAGHSGQQGRGKYPTKV